MFQCPIDQGHPIVLVQVGVIDGWHDILLVGFHEFLLKVKLQSVEHEPKFGREKPPPSLDEGQIPLRSKDLAEQFPIDGLINATTERSHHDHGNDESLITTFSKCLSLRGLPNPCDLHSLVIRRP